ncbi:CATRA conflict system CASPASE/TPR repeat-associated protein [Micromonospora sp. NBC_01796]|uniref:CATRA conflict system CASPASE/TPR repeat-associated protein n=1 Tax=Micromonospora sp. NBC_01796 TaxID=2975987 RepID=UPI002DD84AC3|nr:CATRA conflict system CASPASE/TPR repeat-associated protein [Micromonospora sp. NBC_01796]WSA86663.1 nucleotide-binding protein [Micromonospora sp. NBC_01796]
MATNQPVEQEFIAHLFAPLTGPYAETALSQLRRLWSDCRDDLGMTRAIAGVRLSTRWPEDPRAEPDGALAGLQDPLSFQALVRKEHDVLSVSLAMASPTAPPRSRRGIGSAAPPTWPEFARWWRLLAGRDLGALLGVATVYQAKAADPAKVDVRAALPSQDDDAAAWWTQSRTVNDFAVWEATPRGDHPHRRLVVLARPDEDVRLSRFTWNEGETSLPPLARYLMHAAKLRYHSRVYGDGRELRRLRERVVERLDRLTELLRTSSGGADRATEASALAADEAELIAVLERLRRMRRSVDIARADMGALLTERMPTDAVLGDWLTEQLQDDAEYLEATRERAERLRAITGTAPAPPVPSWSPVLNPPVPDPPASRSERYDHRIGFGIDVISYSSRSAQQQAVVQTRVAALVERVVRRTGLRLDDTDRQDAGDGMLVVLPAGLEVHRILPELLHGWRAELVRDNAAHPEARIRMRLSVAAGPIAASAIGFSGGTVIEVGRLLDSAPLRALAVHHPEADVVAAISDRLHLDVVREGHPGLTADEFQPCQVRNKTFEGSAWLWTGAAVPAAPTQDPGPAVAPAGRTERNVFVIHGRDGQAASAVYELLRELDLRPYDWNEIVARTGEPVPFLGEVFEQAFADNQAAVVILTPDDGAVLHPDLRHPDDDRYERMAMGQSRPNVLFEAGMALALRRDRTLVVEIGNLRPFAHLGGRDVVRFTADPDQHLVNIHKIAQRLRNAGCAVDTDGTRWLDTSRFRDLDAYTRMFDPDEPAGPRR